VFVPIEIAHGCRLSALSYLHAVGRARRTDEVRRERNIVVVASHAELFRDEDARAEWSCNDAHLGVQTSYTSVAEVRSVQIADKVVEGSESGMKTSKGQKRALGATYRVETR
jgi:hypothetical protein